MLMEMKLSLTFTNGSAGLEAPGQPSIFVRGPLNVPLLWD